MNIGRNDPCSCGSGKKYKRCLHKLGASGGPERPALKPITIETLHSQLDELDDMSNRALELIEAGKLAEAENLCRELRSRYPDQIDWIERTALVHKAKGELRRAAEYFRRAAAFAESKDGFDRGYIVQLRRDALEMERRA